MTLRQTADDYQAMSDACKDFLDGWQPADLTPVRVERSRQILGCDELGDALQAYVNAQGWVLFTDRRMVLPAGADTDWAGTVLNAEIYRNNQSIRITRRGQHEWLWVQIGLAETNHEEATHLGTELAHQTVDLDVGQLRYRQLWCRDEQNRLRVEDAVFQGFTGA